MWYIHESTHQNEINIINFTIVLFNYVVDKKPIIEMSTFLIIENVVARNLNKDHDLAKYLEKFL